MRYSEEKKDLVCALYKSGKNVPEIESILGISNVSIYKILNYRGLRPYSRKKPAPTATEVKAESVRAEEQNLLTAINQIGILLHTIANQNEQIIGILDHINKEIS